MASNFFTLNRDLALVKLILADGIHRKPLFPSAALFGDLPPALARNDVAEEHVLWVLLF